MHNYETEGAAAVAAARWAHVGYAREHFSCFFPYFVYLHSYIFSSRDHIAAVAAADRLLMTSGGTFIYDSNIFNSSEKERRLSAQIRNNRGGGPSPKGRPRATHRTPDETMYDPISGGWKFIYL